MDMCATGRLMVQLCGRVHCTRPSQDYEQCLSCATLIVIEHSSYSCIVVCLQICVTLFTTVFLGQDNHGMACSLIYQAWDCDGLVQHRTLALHKADVRQRVPQVISSAPCHLQRPASCDDSNLDKAEQSILRLQGLRDVNIISFTASACGLA